MNTALLKKTLSNPLALSGFIIIIAVLILALFAPIIAPYDPNEIDVKSILLAPSHTHWMGTDG
ncbi:MAG TPA: peptide ABC transporter permease, partial [Methylophilus sp.]|nr:peptide ABC transporter permease [Methylophilus sp.]